MLRKGDDSPVLAAFLRVMGEVVGDGCAEADVGTTHNHAVWYDKRMKVALSPELERFVEEQVKAGRFASPVEVVEAGLAPDARSTRRTRRGRPGGDQGIRSSDRAGRRSDWKDVSKELSGQISGGITGAARDLPHPDHPCALCPDLEGIFEYIRQDSPQNAAKMIRTLLDSIDGLEILPRRFDVPALGFSAGPSNSIDAGPVLTSCGIESTKGRRSYRLPRVSVTGHGASR